jgi:ketosteroid isomerase-like protein
MRTRFHSGPFAPLAPFVLAALAAFAGTACGADDKQPILPPPPPIAPATVTAPPIDTSPPPAQAPTKPSMPEMQLLTIKAIADAISAHDAKKYAGSYANDASLTVYGVGDATGRDAIAADAQKWIDGFGDLKFQAGRLFSSGDMAVVEWAWAGTHNGEFMGKKATQRPVGVSGASVVWFNADGLVTKEHRYFDMSTLLAEDDPKAKKESFRAPPALPSSIEVHLSKGGADEDKLVDVVKSFYAALTAKKEADFLAFIGDDTVLDDFSQPRALKGKKDFRAFFASFIGTYAETKETTSALFAADDFVVAERVIDGVHAATKKPVKLHVVDVLQIKDGKTISRGFSYANSKELADQLHPPVASGTRKHAEPNSAAPVPAPKKTP